MCCISWLIADDGGGCGVDDEFTTAGVCLGDGACGDGDSHVVGVAVE